MPAWTHCYLLLAMLVAGCTSASSPPAAPAPVAPAQPAASAPQGAAPAAPAASPTAPPRQHLRIGYTALSANQALFWIGVEAGLFAQEGLDVELIRFDGTARALPAMLSGEVPISMLASGALVSAAAQGADVLFFATSSNKLVFRIMTPPHITGVEQLRGQAVGAGGRGSASDYALRYALRGLGLDPDRDVLFRDIPGGDVQTVAALQSGAVLAGAIAPPGDYRAEQLGLRTLVPLADWNVNYQGTAPGTSRAFLTAQRDTVRRFLRGYVRSLHRAKTDVPYTLSILKQYTQLDDERGLEWGYRMYIEPLEPAPYPTY
jgi:NitT/TauT family transport system substrate-binding protein